MQKDSSLSPPITRVILYVKNVSAVSAFYQKYFRMTPLPGATSGWVELAGAAGGCNIALHQAAKTQKSGSAVKLVFGVDDVRGLKTELEHAGMRLGVVHAVDGVEFANAKDPAGNSIQISNRGMSRAGSRA